MFYIKVYCLMFVLSLFLASGLNSAMVATSFSSHKDLEKYSPFECGFLGYEESRSPFSIHFFIVSLIFLVFDVELILIFPFASLFFSSLSGSSVSLLVGFLLALSAGLFMEWEKSMLEWLA